MHLKEGTCLKCSFQRVVIIGRKIGLDYNSWYACLPLIRHVGSKLFANFDSRSERERERERERDCTVFAHESFALAWFLRISKVSQSILLRWGPTCASAFVRQSRTFHSINALRTFYRMHIFLIWRNILSWIPFGSDLDPNHVCKCKERERERLVQTHQSKHCIEGSTSRERERVRQISFYSWNSSTYFKVLCRSLQKIWSYEMSSGFNSWVQYLLEFEVGRASEFWRKNEIV